MHLLDHIRLTSTNNFVLDIYRARQKVYYFHKLIKAFTQNFAHHLPYYIYATALSFASILTIVMALDCFKHDNTQL